MDDIPIQEEKEEQKQIILKKEVLVNKLKAEGGAYIGKPKHDYSLQFVQNGQRPQNFVRDYEEDRRFLEYPKLNELIKLKNEVLQKRATPSQWLQCDLKKFDLSVLGKFDVILIDPPLPEYYRRAQNLGVDLKPFEPWTFEEIQNLAIDQIADTCCFLFLWVGAGEGLDKGRQLFKHWNFRRCEDIVWIKTNKHNFTNKSYEDSEDTLLQHTKEHCLVGIKGAVKRGVDGHFIHANIDTDVIVSEEPSFCSTEKPEELYRIIERFCLGRKRIELFGEDRNKRPGWLTLGKSLSNSNFNLEKYNNFFVGNIAYPEAQGYEGGRYVGSTPEIEARRPRSPVGRQNINVRPANVPNVPMMVQTPFGFGMGMPPTMNNFNNYYHPQQ
jgi:N6-adenosine-specific RNA methylase IME4